MNSFDALSIVISLLAIFEKFVAPSPVTKNEFLTPETSVHIGATASQSAGKIHTDFEKGFIRAEVIAFDDFVTLGGEQAAKDAGKWRLEGKDYVVKDGDVIHFRFNV